MCRPRFIVENDEGLAIFTIRGPICPTQCICCPKDLEYPVSDDFLLLFEFSDTTNVQNVLSVFKFSSCLSLFCLSV